MKKAVIIGGGISGLATCYFLERLAEEKNIPLATKVLEANDYLGGTIHSQRTEGYLCESGPNSYLLSKPEVPKLVDKLNLNDRRVLSNAAAAKRYLFINNRLEKLPEKPPEYLATKLLSFKGKLRVLREPWTKPPTSEDESIAEFAKRHLGQEAVDKLINPMVIGIFAGNADELSLDSCFPVMRALEKEGGGSLFRAMIRRMRAKRKQGSSSPSKAERQSQSSEMGGGNLATFDEGVSVLINSLAKDIKGEIITNSPVKSVEKEDGQFLVKTNVPDKSFTADLVILAAPAYSSKTILKSFDEKLSSLIEKIPYVPVNVVNFGYQKGKLTHSLDGFGFLVPRISDRKILGSIWTSSVFNGMCPEGCVSLRNMIGGARNPELTDLDDQQTIKLVQEELFSIMGIKADPDFVNIIRHQKAIPQYVVGHKKLISEIDQQVSKHPGLFITGNAYRGVALDDCVRNANLIAEQAADYFA